MTKPSRVSEPSNTFRYFTVAVLCFSALPLLALPAFKLAGWLSLLLLATLLLVQYRSRFSQHMLLLVISLSVLGFIPINTNVSYDHMANMGMALVATIVIPFAVTTYIFKERIITFPFRIRRAWSKREIAYILFAGFASYLILPFYLASTNSYQNWEAILEPGYIARLFIGTNALGIWDEVFFVGVCLALLRQHIPFIWANLAQSSLWTIFLYELGFRGWGPIAIFLFALSQGYIFKQSKSMLYIIVVHLTIDFMLFLTLVHLHNPDYLRIFITSPF